jgi:hypothetical protein
MRAMNTLRRLLVPFFLVVLSVLLKGQFGHVDAQRLPQPKKSSSQKKRATTARASQTTSSSATPSTAKTPKRKQTSSSKRRKSVLENLTLDEVSLTFLVLEKQMLVEELPPNLQCLSPDDWERLAFLLSSLQQSQLTSSLH